MLFHGHDSVNTYLVHVHMLTFLEHFILMSVVYIFGRLLLPIVTQELCHSKNYVTVRTMSQQENKDMPLIRTAHYSGHYPVADGRSSTIGSLLG